MRHFMPCLALFLVVSAVAAEPYSNSRFCIAAEVPEGFRASAPPANGDGRTFRNAETGAELKIWGAHARDEGFVAYRAFVRESLAELGVAITYSVSAEDWFVLSGLRGARILYLRVEAAEGCGEPVLAHLQITYPADERATYDVLTGPLGRSLRGTDSKTGSSAFE